MEAERAKQILWSGGEIEVYYNGAPVWIERVDAATRTAVVRNLQNEACLEVPLTGLLEDDTHQYLR